jgi:hypothetical protein
MILSTGRVDQAMGVHLQQIYKTNSTPAVTRAGKADVVDISSFAAAIDRARKAIDSMPDVRNAKVLQARVDLMSGNMPQVTDVASAMINRAANGEV